VSPEGSTTSQNKSDISWWHRHPVLTNAAGGVLAAAILGALAQFAGWITLVTWWQAGVTALAVAWQWVTASTPVPHWFIGLMAVAVLGWLAVLVTLLTTNQKEVADVFNALAYNSDIFFNMRWRWQWVPGVGPDNPTPFCLNCDMQLFAEQGFGAGVAGRIEFRCKDCRLPNPAWAAGPFGDISWRTLRRRLDALTRSSIGGHLHDLGKPLSEQLLERIAHLLLCAIVHWSTLSSSKQHPTAEPLHCTGLPCY